MENDKAYLVITTYRALPPGYSLPPAACRKFSKLSCAIRYAKEEAGWESADMVVVTSTSDGVIEMTIPGDYRRRTT